MPPAGHFLVMLVFIIGAVIPRTAHGSPGVEVRTISPALIHAVPGEIITASFRVSNFTDMAEVMVEKVSLPGGWRELMPPVEFFLGPGEETVRLVVFRAATHAPAGVHEIIYSAESIRDYALTDSAGFEVAVEPVYDLVFLPEDRVTEQVPAGVPFQFRARLINRGNLNLSGKINADVTAGGEVSVSPGTFWLRPGGSIPVAVRVRPDPDETRFRRHTVKLEALAEETADGKPVSAVKRFHFRVVPLVSGEDQYYRYPMELSAYLRGDDDDYGFQFGFRGDGYLDEDRTKRLDFFVTAPDRFGRGVFARRDEYAARYRGPSSTAAAGDRAYGLSPLTSLHRYGRGAGLDLHPAGARTAAGAYYARDRWSLRKRSDTGGYLSFSPRPETSLQMNILSLSHEQWEDSPSFRDNIASIGGELRFPGEHRLSAEVGYSEGGEEEEKSDSAWRLSSSGRTGWGARYRLSGHRARPDFAGRYSDSARYSGALAFPVYGPYRGDISYRRYERNLDISPALAAPREDLYSAGLSRMLPAGWRLYLDYEFYDRKDARPDPSYEVEEHSPGLGVGYTRGAFSGRAEARRSRTENLFTEDTHYGWDYRLYTAYRHGRQFNFSFHGRFGDDGAPGESRYLRPGRSFGGRLNWTPSRDLSIYAHYTRYDREFPDIPLRERIGRDHYGAGVSYTLPPGHKISLNARRTETGDETARTYYSASYSIPFAPALGRRESVGALSGRVYRAGEPGGPGVPGAVVYAGETAALTDSRGRFEFRTLPPGDYRVSVDELSAGLDYTPERPGPVEVRVRGGKTVESSIGLVRAARLSGRVLRMHADNNMNNFNNNNLSNSGPDNAGPLSGNNVNLNRNDASTENNGLPNVLVELSGNGETRRTVSRAGGEFLFERLQPGEWFLKVYTRNLPDYHYPEFESRAVEMGPGEEKEIDIHILPRLREIRIIDEGRVDTSPAGD